MSLYDKICRICLGQHGAFYPIFEKIENFEHNIQSKISTCLYVTVEDVKGYPRQICNNCNETLDILFNFIKVFKESCQTLESKLLLIKIDIDASSNNDSDFDPTINKKKDSTIQDLDANITLSIKPRSKASVESEEKQVVKKVLQKEQLRTNINRDIRNAVASSILEGVFTWSGEEWCLNKNKADDTNNLMEQKDAIQSKTKIKTIKKKEIPTERKPQPPRLCDLCGDVFNEDHKLIAHKKRVHFNNPIKCPVCPMTCSSEYYLNCHMERRHRNNKIYECKFCDSKFAFIKDIHKHVEYVHEKKRKGNKIFACDTCDKTYKCVQSLTIHKRSVHTGERPDICTVCGARFFHIIYLREHMRLHTGETPYKCPICNRGYAQRGNMTSHLRNHRKSELDAATFSKIKPRLLKFLKP